MTSREVSRREKTVYEQKYEKRIKGVEIQRRKEK